MNKDLNFEYIEDFADYIIGKIEEDEELFISVIGKFETIKLILKEVMMYEFVDFESIEIENELIDNYTDEFILSLWMNDGVIEVGCEKLKRHGEYINPCGDETYLMEDCSSKVIPLCEDSDLYFVSFCDECDCDEDCDKCDCCGACAEIEELNDKDIHGFTIDESTGNGYHRYSFYTSDSLNKSDIYKMLKDFGF